ncbi:early endosome antigen 1-like isoform X3 [Physella acuta]|uniref:early endosome antigen 1-like isoform X3 n=1 Tax=Physella acuta TaxID=109671 RepID=UPI0027DE906D|nr:early endosome antigen 1-like isoform X3 [Physella acuta]
MDLKIPFRCPHCGDTQKFDTLQDLRHHLEGQHSYRSRRRINLSNGSSFSGRHSPLMELFHADAQKLEESLRKYKEDELNNKRIRRENVGTHLTKSPAYSERKHFKEKVRDGNQHRFKNYPVETAIYNVGAHKQQSFISGALSDSDVEFYPTKLENLHSIPLYSRSNPRNLGERHVKETLSSLSHEVMHERATQQATADSLYSTEELLINVEQAAEIKIAQQQRVIETLAEKLKFKEKRLEMITKQIENLGQQQIENLEKAHKLQEQSDYTTELLQQQLLQKQKELDALNLKMEKMHDYFNKGDKPEKLKLDESTKGFKLVNEKNLHDTDTPKDFRLQNLRSPTIQHVADNVSNPGILIDSPRRTIPADTNSKDKELILIKTKAHQLDRDRQNLLFEMQSLLETAALDNEKLQSELESQRQELSQLNSELEHSKHEQTELLGETNALYHQADVSLAKLKTLLKEREHQLASLTNSLEQARSTQARLAQERDECLKLAAEREAIYQTKISSNKVQVKEMKETLDNSLSEKKKLEKDLIKLKTELDAKDGKDKQLLEKMAVLKAKLTEREKSQAKLKEELKKREEKLKKAKHEMQRMTNYLKDTAEKEIEARAKLETFISGLIDRAGQAEEELERLKASFGHSLQHAATPRKHKRDITGALDLSSLPGVSPTGSPMPQAGDFSTSVSEEEPSESNFQKHSTLLKGQISPVYKRRTEIDRHRGRQEHDQSFHVRGYRTGNHSRQPPEKELDRSAGLSIDENGILWEQVPSSGFSPLSKSSRKNFPGRPAKQGNMELFKLGDDTDVDEDLTDYLNEDELKSYDQNSKVKLSPINKAKISSLQKDPIPLGDKIAKLLTSLNPTESAAREDYHKNLYTQNLKQPTHASKAANEYSSEESSPSSPLHKAQQVQKRVEQLTNERPKFVNTLSKQSYGFDVSQLDSDLSVSSYASLSQVKNQHREAHVKPIEKNEETKPLEEDVMVATHVKRGPKNPSLTVEPIEAPAASTPAKGSLGAKIHNKPEPEAGVPKHQPDEKSTQAKEEFTLPKICNAKENEKIDLPIQTDTKDTKETNVPKVSNITTFDQSVKNVNAASQEKQTHEPAKEADEDLAKYQDVELKPARELRVRTLNSATSEEDLLDSESKEKQETLVEEVTDNSNTHDAAEFIGDTSLENFTDDTEGPAFNPKRKESVDASTDTDLEKLAKPGYLQKGLTVKKNVPTVKFIRKKRKQRPPLKQTHSQELLSSDTEDLDDNEKIKQAALRRMRIALFRVFAYLDTASLLVASTVCREWRKVSRHPALWKSVWLENKTISSSFLLTLSQWCTQTQAFTLQGLRGRGIRADESPEIYLSAVRGSLEPGLEKFLSACQNTISSLHISDCDNIITDKCLWLVSGYCRLLTKLTYQSKLDPITPQLMWALGGGCPGVTSLFVQPKYPCEKVNAMNNRCLLLIGQFYKDIQDIGLGGKEFDTAGLISLIQSCQRLRNILFDHSIVMTSDVASALCKAGLKQLQSISIVGTSVEAKAIQSFQGNCRQLKKIYIKMNIEDCVTDPTKKKDKEQYKKLVKALQTLKTKAGFTNILTLDLGPAE